MKRSTSMLQPALSILVLTSVAVLSSPSFGQTDAQKAFTAIKNLPGSWEGKSQDGQAVQVDFKLTAGGSAVMSEILVPNHDMISMFHLDGANRLLMTHYCAAGNQPRMQASIAPDGRTITFSFVDATNLQAPDAGHMQQVVLTLIDDNHHTEEWTFADHGKKMKQVFDLRRKL